jgi:hypothetical protein
MRFTLLLVDVGWGETGISIMSAANEMPKAVAL